jgi:hypothetical protein
MAMIYIFEIGTCNSMRALVRTASTNSNGGFTYTRYDMLISEHLYQLIFFESVYSRIMGR